ncbi:MAG: helix-turn-helix transcriptional regulator [Lachnospiraceae bacterium]|nr:helix-turn-helix transcriptional regulator [Lachnospiraceae bacterium]
MNYVGDFIAELRVTKNLSRIELAQQLDIPYKSVDLFEDGQALPDKSELKKICSFFEVTQEELLCGRKLFYEDGSRYAAKELIKEKKQQLSKRVNRFRLMCAVGVAVALILSAFAFAFREWGCFAAVLSVTVAASVYLYAGYYAILRADDDIIPVRTRYANYVDVVKYAALSVAICVILSSISAFLCLGGNTIVRICLCVAGAVLMLAGVRYVMEGSLWKLEKRYKKKRIKDANIIHEPSEVDEELEKLEGLGIF